MYVLVFLAPEQCVHFLCASYSQLVQTIIDQCHLSPLPLSVQPINWQLDYTLRLYPMPTTVLILLFFPIHPVLQFAHGLQRLYFILFFVASSYWRIATSGTNSRMKAATSSILGTSSGMISGSRRISLTVAAQKLRKSLRHLFVQQRCEVLICWVS